MEIYRSPREVHQALTDAFNTKNLEEIVSLYETNSVLLPGPGQFARGKEEITDALKAFLAIEGIMEAHTVFVIENDELALARSSWKIASNGQIVFSASDIEILRKQADGSWKILIDHPAGGN